MIDDYPLNYIHSHELLFGKNKFKPYSINKFIDLIEHK